MLLMFGLSWMVILFGIWIGKVFVRNLTCFRNVLSFFT